MTTATRNDEPWGGGADLARCVYALFTLLQQYATPVLLDFCCRNIRSRKAGASWEQAATRAVETASKTLQDLRIAEVEELDMQIENGKVSNYRAKVRVSFKYHGKEM